LGGRGFFIPFIIVGYEKWNGEIWMVVSDMRRFQLHRSEDESGVSGVGVVAEGVEFTSGWVALTWLSPLSCVAFYQNIKEVEAIHGHEGRTTIRWIDA
jgi:hypothetical protein